MSLRITIDGIETLDLAFTYSRGTLYSDVAKGVDHALDSGVNEAKTRHPYKDRTGNLTKSIDSALTHLDTHLVEGEITAGGDAAPYAAAVNDGTKPHPIDAKKGKWLAWENPEAQGDWHFAKHVNHPGTSPYPFMKLAEERALIVLDTDVAAAVERLIDDMAYSV